MIEGCAFKRAYKIIETIQSVLVVKLLLKKKSAILNGVVSSQIYTKSFGGGNLALCSRICPIKSQSMFDLWLDSV